MAKSGKKKSPKTPATRTRPDSDAKPASARPAGAGMKKASATGKKKTSGSKKAPRRKDSDAKPASSKPGKKAATKKAAAKKSVKPDTNPPAGGPTSKKKPTKKKKSAAKKTAKKKSVTKKAPTAKKSAGKKKPSAPSTATKKSAKRTGRPKPEPVARTRKAAPKQKSAAAPTTASKKATLRAATQQTPATTPAKLGNKPGVPTRPYASLDLPTPTAQGYDPHNNTPPTPQQMRKVKTGLSAKDLRRLRQGLLEHRAEIIGDVQGLEAARSGSAGELSHMPLHMADVGSDSYEQEFMLGLMQSERQLIVEIDEALMRIVDGTYGVCIETNEPIGKPRLEAKPWAKYCIEVARERERRGMDR